VRTGNDDNNVARSVCHAGSATTSRGMAVVIWEVTGECSASFSVGSVREEGIECPGVAERSIPWFAVVPTCTDGF
jgi:hypothetical protein